MLLSEHLDDGAATALATRNLPSPKKPVSIATQTAPVRECHSKYLDIESPDLFLRAFSTTALHYTSFRGHE
jgi:hypothetical protein